MFKTFTAIPLPAATAAVFKSRRLVSRIAEHPIADPGATTWSTMGFVKPDNFGEEIAFTNAAGHVVMCVEFRERLLPAKVIKKAIADKADEWRKRGEKITRKLVAQIKETVVDEMLPKAFIKPSHVLVVAAGHWLLIGSGSPRVVDSVLSLLHPALADLGNGKALSFPRWQANTDAKFAEALLHGNTDIGGHLQVGSSYALKKGSSVIRVKEGHLTDEELTDLLNEGYVPTELRLEIEDALAVTITDKMVFRQLGLSRVAVSEARKDAAAASQDVEDAVAEFETISFLTTQNLLDLLRLVLPWLPPASDQEDDEVEDPNDPQFADDGDDDDDDDL